MDGFELAEKYAVALGEKFPADEFTVDRGRKFARIVLEDGGGVNRGVFAFVEKTTGALVKAAGWSAPAHRANGALQSKYNLNTNFEGAIADADLYGSFLYL